MKRIVLLSLLLFPIFLFAQYPTFSNKQKLGVQTTGDGLIYRGRNNPNYYTPSNINNAYFYLDTLTSKLYLYNISDWQQIYPTTSDTTSLGNFLLKSDTLAMLLPYLRKADTISLSNRINNKLNATDTVSLSNRINLKLNQTDTINLSNRIDLKLNKSDTISLSNRINTKLNTSDTVSLSNRINKKLDTIYIQYPSYIDTILNKDTINITTLEAGLGINIANNIISLDTILLDSIVSIKNVYVKNGTGTILNKGEAVYVTGADGTNIIVGRASNIAESSSSKTLGLTMTSIPVNGFGYVIKEGLLAGLNTNSANAGDPVWLSNTPGGLIFGLTNKPYAPNHLVYLGIVTRKQQNNGEIYVTVQNGFEIKELHDVQITDPVNKASLYYNSSENLWRDTTATLLVSDTASMLSKYVNTYSNQTNINGDKTFNNVVTIDSATVTGKLLVNTNINDAVKITSNTNSTNLELMNNSGTVYIKSSNKNMILQTDTTALVYLNGNNKKVGILTMSPQQELQVAGNVRIDSLNNNLVPVNLVGSSNNNDLTSVHLGQGLSFTNDTLKVDLTIIDTAIAASSITLVGNVSGTGSTNSTVNTVINNGVVTNDMLAGGISDSKLNTITTAGKVDNSATTATSSNNPNTIVLRDASRNFTANNITANNFYGLASTSTIANSIQSNNTTGIIKLTTSSNAVLPILTVPDVNATIATTNLNQTFGGTQTFTNTIIGNISGNAATVTSVTPSNFASQSANTVLAAPNGSSGTPSFRSLVSSDIPSLNYLPLTGGTLTGLLKNTSQRLTGNITISDFDNTYSSVQTGPSSSATVNLAIQQNITGSSNISMGGNQGGGGEPFSPNIYFTDNRKAYASIGGIHTSGGTNNQSGHIVFNTTPSVNTIALTERMRITQDGLVSIANNATIGGTLGVTGATTLSDDLILRTSGGSRFQTAIRHYYEQQSRYASEIQFLPSGSSGSALTFITNQSGFGQSEKMRIDEFGNIGINTSSPNAKLDVRGSVIINEDSGDNDTRIESDGNANMVFVDASTDRVGIGTSSPSKTLDVNGQIGSTGFIKSGGESSQFLKADGSVDANTYLTTGTAASTYLPLTGGTVSGTINRADQFNDGSPLTAYYNILNYYARRDNVKGNQTAQITFTDRPGTATFENNVRTSDIYLMTARNFNGSQLGQYLDTTFSVVANQDGGRIGISKLNPAYKLDVNGTLGVTGATTLSNLSGSGTRMVTANSTGVLSTQAIPTGTLVGTDTVSLSNRINGKVSLTGNESISGTKTFNSLVNLTSNLILSGSYSGVNKLLGKNSSDGVGNITVGSGLNLTNDVLTATSTGTVTSVSALTIGTSGSNITSSIANSTTTPVITLNIPDANIGVRGVVTSGNQTFGGSKTFNDNIFVNGIANFTSTPPGGFNVTGTNISFASYPAGTLSVNANGYVTSSSDSTLKIADGFIDSALVKINKLIPRYYYWKDNTLLNRQLGFFAQEVNSILGEEVAPTPTNGNKYGIYDISIVAYLVKAVQEQQLIIDTLKNEIDKIKEDIIKLKQN